jgi:hypothetical protein
MKIIFGMSDYERAFCIGLMWKKVKPEPVNYQFMEYEHWFCVTFYQETLLYVFRILKRLIKVRFR